MLRYGTLKSLPSLSPLEYVLELLQAVRARSESDEMHPQGQDALLQGHVPDMLPLRLPQGTLSLRIFHVCRGVSGISLRKSRKSSRRPPLPKQRAPPHPEDLFKEIRRERTAERDTFLQEAASSHNSLLKTTSNLFLASSKRGDSR